MRSANTDLLVLQKNKMLYDVTVLIEAENYQHAGKYPERIIKKLCDDGEIGKPECQDCEARFTCFTRKK